MEFQNIAEFHCDICFELFGENRKCPKILTCGHSFCQSCLENLLIQSPSCPNCKRRIQFPNVDCIPVNYSIKSLVSRFNVANQVRLNEQNSDLNTGLSSELKDKSQELPYEGYCAYHHVCKHLRCMDCKCWVCSVCVALDHKPCRTLLVAEAFKEMKQETSHEVESELEAKNSQSKYLDIYVTDLEGKRSSLKIEIKKLQFDLRSKIETLRSFGKTIEQLQLLKSEIRKHCEKVKAMETKVTTTSTDAQFMKATSKLNDFLDQSQKLMEEMTIPRYWYGHLSIEVLRAWCQNGSVYASRFQNGMNQYGQVKVIGNRVWVHCFQLQRPQMKNVIISFREVLVSFNESSELPRRGFIQVEDETFGLKDVVIATDALTPRAMNFLLLCSGIKGRSYEGVDLEGFGFWIRTPFNVGEAVVKGINDVGVYEAPRKKGLVGGCEARFTDSLSRFFIWMEDDPSTKLFTKFGFVEEGLDLCERIYKNKSKVFAIKHCGLVI